jgi:hypothetical protein
MEWLVKNMEWVFSGIGVALLGWLISFRKSRAGVDQSVKNSSNVTQVGGNVTVGESNDRAKR